MSSQQLVFYALLYKCNPIRYFSDCVKTQLTRVDKNHTFYSQLNLLTVTKILRDI